MTGRVLVIDDEPNLLEVFGDVLRDIGYEVETAGDARRALGLLSENSFDVVVSDITMPYMTGVELLQAVHERDPDLPVVLVTGNPTLETAIQALERGAVQYLLKPVSIGALQGAVERALHLRRMANLRREALVYLKSHHSAVADRAGLEASLTRAVGQFWMAYQPILRAKDGSTFGFEALVRSREASLPHPGAIFEAAEQLGRVIDVGREVRRLVAADMAEAAPGLRVFLNLHTLDLGDELLLSAEAPLTKRAKNVVLEITERASLEVIPDYRTRIRTLREMGFRIAVDDLGAGYAGLNTFAALEPEVVKLDIELVRGAHAEAVKQKLIRSVCSVCRDLGILVVAEGIETASDRDAVIDLGCDLLQGFLLGRPAAQPLTAAARPSPSGPGGG
ncbi:MAG TPA: EAL domain-containing protein [Vicinamibacteria bacterium]|nr:EAL domain-containing protein [Vicinamibacteria bacterium]